MTNDQSRRDFLKKSALTTAGIGFGAMAFSQKVTAASSVPTTG